MNEHDAVSLFLPKSDYKITKQVQQHWDSERFSYADRPRPDHGLLMLLEGNILFLTSEGRLLAEPGDVIYLPENSRYEACIFPQYGKTEDILINFKMDPPPRTLRAPVRLLNTQSESLTEEFRQAVKHRPEEESEEFRRKGQFYLLLGRLVAQIKGSRGQNTVKQAERLLTEREEMSVGEIAKACGLSESGLRHAFFKAYGLSPQKYRIRARIEKAKFLLESTSLSVYEIAEKLNFYDEAYFCKTFRKYVGLSPRAYGANKSI